MIKKLHFPKIILLALLLLIIQGAYSQKKTTIHIKVTDDTKKIDTLIEFDKNIDADKIKSIVEAITGEEFEVDIHKKGNNKMVWISDDDSDNDFEFKFDIDIDIDSALEGLEEKLSEYNTFNFDDLSDSMLLKHDIIRDSLNNFVFAGDDKSMMKWISNDTIAGKNVFIFKDDTVYTNGDSVFHLKGDEEHIIMRSHNSDNDSNEFIMEFEHKNGKKSKMKMKTRVNVDDESGDEDVFIKKDKNGKVKTIIIEIEDDDEQKDIE